MRTPNIRFDTDRQQRRWAPPPAAGQAARSASGEPGGEFTSGVRCCAPVPILGLSPWLAIEKHALPQD